MQESMRGDREGPAVAFIMVAKFRISGVRASIDNMTSIEGFNGEKLSACSVPND